MRALISKMGLAITMLAVICVGIASAGEVTKMRAKLRSETVAFAVSGTARYAELEVLVNGASVGTMKVDELGVGDLNYDSRIHPGDEDWQQFPANFPEIHIGDVVTVGRIVGTMQGR
jgi:hypothetical protein